jgi:HAD superfamily hydrolase (TIGR01490 family)
VKLAIFDLDHTLLAGDSDVLWCQFLIDRGVLDRAGFEPRNQRMERDYKAGTVGPVEFCEFYVSTLAARTPAQWAPMRQSYLATMILPRISQAARDLVGRHRKAGDLMVMSTATNRFLTELTAAQFGIEHLIATEVELGADGRYTGRVSGTANMREGKLTRLNEWLASRQAALSDFESSTMYGDSINDLPLLDAVRVPVPVDPDAQLAAVAAKRGWPVLRLHSTEAASSKA